MVTRINLYYLCMLFWFAVLVCVYCMLCCIMSYFALYNIIQKAEAGTQIPREA